MKKLIEIARFTDDVAAMTDFYERLLGFAPIARSESTATFMLQGVKLFIHKTPPAVAGQPPNENHLAFSVEDMDVANRELETMGLALEFPPTSYAWGASAYLRDPDGNLIEIHKSE